MTTRRAANRSHDRSFTSALAISALSGLVCASACKRAPAGYEGADAAASASTAPAATATVLAAPGGESARSLDGDAGDGSTSAIPAGQWIEVTRTDTSAKPPADIVGAAPGATAAPVDPFAAPSDAVRRSALGCFTGLAAGEYAATLTIHVTPAGLVSRTELAPGNVDDEAVQACLKRAADAGRFPTSPTGRTLNVEVRVRG